MLQYFLHTKNPSPPFGHFVQIENYFNGIQQYKSEFFFFQFEILSFVAVLVLSQFVFRVLSQLDLIFFVKIRVSAFSQNLSFQVL